MILDAQFLMLSEKQITGQIQERQRLQSTGRQDGNSFDVVGSVK